MFTAPQFCNLTFILLVEEVEEVEGVLVEPSILLVIIFAFCCFCAVFSIAALLMPVACWLIYVQ